MRSTLSLHVSCISFAGLVGMSGCSSSSGHQIPVGSVLSGMRTSGNTVGSLGGPTTNTGTNTGTTSGTAGCAALLSCLGTCSNTGCSTACRNEGSLSAKSRFDAMLGCLDAACPSTSVCASTTSTACDNCYSEAEAEAGACASAIAVCENDNVG